MIISGLTIFNFKNYSGYNRFDFSLELGKNVILIGGMNGAGKTTLSESIRLCLYGNKFNGSPLSESKYAAYLDKMWSKTNLDQNMYIEMDVEVDEADKKMNITIKREFSRKEFNSNKVSEVLTLTRNGIEVELIDKKYWDYYLQSIIPAHISRYFFFDGERTRDVISSKESGEYLRTAIRDITEISKLDTLSTDLLEVKKRLLRNDIKPSVKKKINEIEKSIQKICFEVSDIRSEIDILNQEKNQLESKIEEQKQEYNRIIGIKENEREAALNTLQDANVKLSIINEKVSDFAYSILVKIILKDVLLDALDVARKEDLVNNQIIINDFVDKKIHDIFMEISSLMTDSNDVNKIMKIIRKSFTIDSGDDTKTIIDLTPSQINEIESQLEISEEPYVFVNNISEREKLMIQKSRLEKEYSKFDETGDSFDDVSSELSNKLHTNGDLINQKMGALQVKSEDLDILQRELDKLERSLTLSERDKAAVNNIDSLINLIKIKNSIASEKSITIFEGTLNEMYNLLKNKDDMVKIIHVNEDYSLRLEGFDGSNVDVEWISEGEKGILMYSVMFALTSLSKSKLPVIVDSPLGRMDSIHVRNLITHLYPRIGNQVIILSHDREITKDILPIISPIISKSYLLSRKEPKVHEGYFE